MTKDQYEKAKIELEEKRWKLKQLSEGHPYAQHMKMQIEFLEHLILKYEDCYHINKSVIEHLIISVEVLKLI